MSSTGVLPTIGPVDLAAERASLGTALEDALRRVLHSGQYVLGPEVEAFEREFSAFQRARFGLGVNSGTDALVLALKALGIGRGDGVLTSPFTFFASAGAIAWIGARVQLADVEPDTGLLSLERARAACDASTRCILPSTMAWRDRAAISFSGELTRCSHASASSYFFSSSAMRARFRYAASGSRPVCGESSITSRYRSK